MYRILKTVVFKLLSFLNRVYPLSNKDSVILCYHSICSDGWIFSTHPRVFEKQIIEISNKRKIVELNKLINSNIKKSATITFDDGYENIYKNAYPILKKYGLTATVFLTEQSHLNNKNLLNTSQIKKLISNGWTIGYHTKSHVNCTKLNAKVLEYEVSPGNLEKKINTKIIHFAYPYGYYNKEVKNIISNKYDYCYSVSGGAFDNKDRLQIPRVTVDSNLSIDIFNVLLTDIGLKINKLFEQILFSYRKYV